MPIHEHQPTLQGRTFLWGGIGLGAVFLAALLTRGFGFLGGSVKGIADPELMVRQGDQIVVPSGSARRTQVSPGPAWSESVSLKLSLPAVVESDPARTAAVLTPL